MSILILGSIDVRTDTVLTNKPESANRRLSPRRVTDVEVSVAREGGEIKKCRLRDISIDGAFIETKKFMLTEGAKLDLVLRVLREESTEACPVPAEVIRVVKNGAALIFGRVDQRLYNILADIVSRTDRISTGNETAFFVSPGPWDD